MDLDSNPLKRCSSAPHINADLVVPMISNLPTTQVTFVGSSSNTSGQLQSSSPAMCKVFTPRARRFSASFSPRTGSPSSKLVPRISQLRQEECADREVNHERGVISDLQMSQSYDDLSIITEGWSMKSDDNGSATNPLHLNLTMGNLLNGSSSPSPTRHLRFPYHSLTPSPTRRAFATRRSMSPVTMRPSQLVSGSVKRKFEMDEVHSNGCSSTYSPPLKKKIFMDRQTPSPMLCPSPDSCASYEGRITPKHFVSKLIISSSTALPTSTSVTSSPATETSCGDVSDMDTASDSTTSQAAMPVSCSTDESSLDSTNNLFKEPGDKMTTVTSSGINEAEPMSSQTDDAKPSEADENVISTTSSL